MPRVPETIVVLKVACEQTSGERDVTTERTPLGEEIEAALEEVLAHARGETALPCRVTVDSTGERNIRRSAMTETGEGGSMTIRDNGFSDVTQP